MGLALIEELAIAMVQVTLEEDFPLEVLHQPYPQT